MRKIALLSVTLFTAFVSRADIRIETCIQDHVQNTNCFLVQVTIIDDTKDGPIMVSQGSAWIGSQCKENGHRQVPNNNPSCPAVLLNDVEIYTTSSRCMAITDGEIAAAVSAAINSVIGVPITASKRIINQPQQHFRVFPNPASSHITIITSFEEKNQASLYIMDVAGKVVYAVKVQNPHAAQFTLPIKDLVPGNYTVTIKNNKRTLGSQKITVQ